MSPLFPDITVNGELIPSAAIAAEAQNHNAPSDKPGFAWRAAARALAIRALMLQQASKLGLQPQPQPVGENNMETDEESLIRALSELEIEPEGITEPQCQAIYDRQPDNFRAPDLFQPAHMLFPAKPDDLAARADAKANAEIILAKVQANPKSFGHLAKEVSACPSKDNGGQLGQIGSGDTVPEFEVVLKTLPIGEIHKEVVDTRFGFHIIRMDEKALGEQLPFDVVKRQIMERLEQVAWMKAASLYAQGLVESAEITGIDLGQKTNKPN